MRLLYVTPFFLPIIGGVETAVDETCSSLAADGHDVAVVTGPAPGSPPREVLHGIRVVREQGLEIPESGRVNPAHFRWDLVARRFHDLVQELDPDIIHFHNYHMKHYALFLFPFMHGLDPVRRRNFITIHNTTEDPFAHYLLSYMPFSRVVVLTNRSAFDLLRGGVPADRVKVIPNMIDAEKFQRADGAAVRERLGVGEEPVILFPSRLVGREGNLVYGDRGGKGLDILLQAMPLIRREVPEAKLLLMGNDPLYPQVLTRARRTILDLAEVFGMRDSILFFEDPIPQDLVPNIYAAADIVVSLGATECFGMVFLEGMAAGKPVVGINSVDSGVPEVVWGGRAGSLVPPDDPWSTAKAVAEILEKPDLAAEMGRHGLRWVRQKYDVRAVLPQLVGAYEASLGEAGGAPPASPAEAAIPGSRNRGA